MSCSSGFAGRRLLGGSLQFRVVLKGSPHWLQNMFLRGSAQKRLTWPQIVIRMYYFMKEYLYLQTGEELSELCEERQQEETNETGL